MVKLGVNIDHVATVREARKTFEPDPVTAARDCEIADCDGIVCHLRKDRRHVSDRDLALLKEKVTTHLNLEMSVDPEIVKIALQTRPDQATIVPENRQEITTEGGLDVAGNIDTIRDVSAALSSNGIKVSLFIDPDPEQVDAAVKAGVGMVEFHTGRYAEEFDSGEDHAKELDLLTRMCAYGMDQGIMVAAGHGLNYMNVSPVARIPGVYELNIGHSIISRAVYVGIGKAVTEMKELMR